MADILAVRSVLATLPAYRCGWNIAGEDVRTSRLYIASVQQAGVQKIKEKACALGIYNNHLTSIQMILHCILNVTQYQPWHPQATV